MRFLAGLRILCGTPHLIVNDVDLAAHRMAGRVRHHIFANDWSVLVPRITVATDRVLRGPMDRFQFYGYRRDAGYFYAVGRSCDFDNWFRESGMGIGRRALWCGDRIVDGGLQQFMRRHSNGAGSSRLRGGRQASGFHAKPRWF